MNIYNEISILYPHKQIIIAETGWATSRHNEGHQAELIKGNLGENEQAIFSIKYYEWTKTNKIPNFYFEAFDEKWKGGDHPNEVEKHWGLFYSNRTPKKGMNNL